MPFYNSNYQYKFEYYHNMEWSKRFAIIPHRCKLSGKRIWLQYAWYGRKENYYTSGIWYCWHDPKEHIIWKLKGG